MPRTVSLPVRVMRSRSDPAIIAVMLTQLSNQMADAVAQAGSAVVQVQGHRRPASGVVVPGQHHPHDDPRAWTRGGTSRAPARRVGPRRRAGWMGSRLVSGVASCRWARARADHAVERHAARRSSRARAGAVLEQRSHGERRHHLGHRRPAANGAPPLDRRSPSHDGAHARRLCRRRVRGRRGPSGRDHDRLGDPRASAWSSRHRLR